MTAAERVIAAYDHLEAVNAAEPDSDIDSAEWLRWYDCDYRPASAAWGTAVGHFQGYANGLSRHPMNVLPLALAQVEREKAA